MDEQARVRALASCRLFSHVPVASLNRLGAIATVRQYRRGQIVFAEGDSGDSLLVLVSGSLKAYSTSAEGEEFLLAVVGPGDVLGELVIADGGTRSATVSTLSASSVLRLPRDEFLKVANGEPTLMSALLAGLASVIRRLTGDAADLVFLDLPRRVAKLLLADRASAQSGMPVPSLTQTEMATRVGASRQSVNAALQEFQRRGWILLSGHEISIRDPSALSRFVGG
jgi:CRP/FNR family transcriptional regulator, cyclic AMP receptor protein